MPYEFEEEMNNIVHIKVIGVGGGGGNAVDRMVNEGVSCVEFISINTDHQALGRSRLHKRFRLAIRLHMARVQALCLLSDRRLLTRAEMKSLMHSRILIWYSLPQVWAVAQVQVAAPIVAEIAREMGILTIGIVTKPFQFEGKQ